MADSTEKEFTHESLQDRESIARYLKALTDGFASAQLELAGRDGMMSLVPTGLVSFEVKASRKRARVRLSLKFAWREPQTESASDGGPLTIRGTAS